MATDRLFTPEEIKMIDSIPMNFVVGKERSGTTLLQVMLNAHPNIIAPPESRLIVLLNYRYGKTKKWTEKVITNFCNDLFKEGLFRNFWGIEKKNLLNTLIDSKDLLTFPLVCKIIFSMSSPEKKEVCLFFDKNPIYYYFLPKLERIFPDARYIHLVRDYRANVVSHQKAFKLKSATDIAYRWLKTNKLIEKSKVRNPGRYFTLKYEELVANPALCMKEICTFLSIPFSEKMVEDHTSSLYPSFKRNKKSAFKERHGSLFEPISDVHTNEWKQRLSPGKIADAEATAGEYGRKYGYQTVSNKPVRLGLLRLLFIKTKYTTLRNAYKIIFSILPLYYFVKQNVWRDF